ncbi:MULTISPECIES: flavin monoamine oxidase family protein [Rhizobium]|uniref:flavin monoamine oxidase family protein n=1 Tax=Rhizobium TaxID=379 RepID=UPI001C92ABC7|nr:MULTISPECIES: NAD(P)/FAD-dependent oxidoreductase [Rhizobium]MBY3333303.1 FAD-dependent oxidoreductase [Rhizobium laguerreae]MBY3365237.1 FAD-dependent oxidoreductase [Rhizobium laguerreae]MBY3384440.1 FAD-dependent oxidoreductase [Rhizobium laguerreae]MBY3398101.1 FAD-dependent oxidoreductase [Rhizobium laguerreae]MBY3405041.1 FAD-dependent oxidoreductase [Rhizobium laguerreae]
MDYEVAIVGAGAAGIAAAKGLADAGRSVIILEASNRVGGRAWTIELAGMPLDMGCGWLHSAGRNPLVAIGRAAGFNIERGPTAWQSQWHDLGFTPDERAAAAAAWTALEERMRASPPASDRASDALEPDGKWNAYCQSLSGYLNGASLDRLSVSDFLAYDSAATDANWRVHEGYGSLISAAVPNVALRLSTPVRRVAMTGNGIQLETDRGPVTSAAAIITASSTVLAGGAIIFDPEADDHLHAASQLPLGLADKLFLELHGNHGLEPETHLLGDPQNAETGSYYIRPFGRPIIEGFFGGNGAVVIERAGLVEAFAFALDQLSSLLGSNIRRHLRPLAASSWCLTDWVGGSYSHALPGHAGARAVLARPVGDRLFFAGEATHQSDFSTAHGAWESGLRAADQAAAVLPPS